MSSAFRLRAPRAASVLVAPLLVLFTAAGCVAGRDADVHTATSVPVDTGAAAESAAALAKGTATSAAATASAMDSSTSPATASTVSASAPAATTGTADTSKVSAALRTLLPSRGPHDRTSLASAVRAGTTTTWPSGPAAAAGALLPGHRIVAYYGNPHSKKMGVLGEYPEAQMLSMLDRAVAQWKAADPTLPVLPAIHLVAVIAQGDPGPDGKWRRRETPEMIERTYGWAKQKQGVLFLDIQGSHSTLHEELPPLLKYLERPDVHLGVDPEFYMHHDKEGVRPSAKIGQMLASDVNYVIRTVDSLVRARKLPPKVLVVHRFTKQMVPDAESIRPTANVQVVMDMDGWGPAWLKFDSYNDYIVQHPVQYTGFKLFYHNDTKAGGALLTPKEVLQLRPKPLYIQYQ